MHQGIAGELQRGKKASGRLFCRKQRKENCDGPGEENLFLHIGKLAVRAVIFFERKLILIDPETEQGTLNCLLHLSLKGK